MIRSAKMLISLLLAAVLGMAMSNPVFLSPPAGAKAGKPAALVWIQGYQCHPEAYKDIAVEIQKAAAESGIALWVGIPDFAFETPEPLLVGAYVKSTITALKAQNFTGEDVFLGGHSMGGAIAEWYSGAQGVEKLGLKGLVLAGSDIIRSAR